MGQVRRDHVALVQVVGRMAREPCLIEPLEGDRCDAPPRDEHIEPFDDPKRTDGDGGQRRASRQKGPPLQPAPYRRCPRADLARLGSPEGALEVGVGQLARARRRIDLGAIHEAHGPQGAMPQVGIGGDDGAGHDPRRVFPPARIHDGPRDESRDQRDPQSARGDARAQGAEPGQVSEAEERPDRRGEGRFACGAVDATSPNLGQSLEGSERGRVGRRHVPGLLHRRWLVPRHGEAEAPFFVRADGLTDGHHGAMLRHDQSQGWRRDVCRGTPAWCPRRRWGHGHAALRAGQPLLAQLRRAQPFPPRGHS